MYTIALPPRQLAPLDMTGTRAGEGQTDALLEARDVFLASSTLPARWQGANQFVICDTHFGDGRRFLATWQAWQNDTNASKRLHFIACESQPYSAADLETLHQQGLLTDSALVELAEQLRSQWPVLVTGFHRMEFAGGRLILTLLLGDTEIWLPKLVAKVDTFYLDERAMASQARDVRAAIYKQFTRLATTDAQLVANHTGDQLSRQLELAGFNVATNNNASIGQFKGQRPSPISPQDRHAIIIGAGLAGAAIAERLAKRDWCISLIDQHTAPAKGASGNHAGAYRPVLAVDDNLQARLSRACFLYGHRRLATFPSVRWQACGSLQLPRDDVEADRLARIAASHTYPSEYLRFVDQAAASELAGQVVACGGVFSPMGGALHPVGLVLAQLAAAHPSVRTHWQTHIQQIQHRDGQWHVLTADGQLIASAATLILANAADASRFAPELGVLADSRVVSHLPINLAPAVNTVVCRGGYLTPLADGLACIGSSLLSDDMSETDAHRANLGLLAHVLTENAVQGMDATELDGRTCGRPNSIDRMPVVGAVADAARFLPKHAGSLHLAPRLPGLYCMTGFGARGLVWSGLMAELLASQICGEPLPIERELALAVDPARFLSRRAC